MPWRTTCPMDERTQFIAARLARDESMSVLCRRFGISRKTGYQLWSRYEAEGPAGLLPRSHAPHRPPHALSEAIEQAILELRETHPRWGPRKLRAWLQQRRALRGGSARGTSGGVIR